MTSPLNTPYEVADEAITLQNVINNVMASVLCELALYKQYWTAEELADKAEMLYPGIMTEGDQSA